MYFLFMRGLLVARIISESGQATNPNS
jgi:hypothetical protein